MLFVLTCVDFIIAILKLRFFRKIKKFFGKNLHIFEISQF